MLHRLIQSGEYHIQIKLIICTINTINDVPSIILDFKSYDTPNNIRDAIPDISVKITHAGVGRRSAIFYFLYI